MDVEGGQGVAYSPGSQIEVGNEGLGLEAGGSLALYGRHSIENGIPIPRNMLSHSEDAFQL